MVLCYGKGLPQWLQMEVDVVKDEEGGVTPPPPHTHLELSLSPGFSGLCVCVIVHMCVEGGGLDGPAMRESS